MQTMLNKHRRSTQEFIGQHKGRGKGIVISAGGLKYFTCAYVLVSMLREYGCSLPIEVWHKRNELSLDMKLCLEKFNVTCRNINDYVQGDPHGFLMKPLAILYSNFKEVLFLDADNNCIKDPTFLFKDANYIKYGCVFWSDYWDTCSENQIWEILNIKPPLELEQESGQLLINKAKCWKALQNVVFLNINGNDYYKFLYGDKDTFRLSWLLEDMKYYQVSKTPGACGKIMNNSFEGTTIIQYDTVGEIIFLHRNLFKWDISNHVDPNWLTIKSYKEDAKVRFCKLMRNSIHNYLHLDGDVDTSPATEAILNYEKSALHKLKKLRNTRFYKFELLRFYIEKN